MDAVPHAVTLTLGFAWQRSNWTPYFTLPRIRAIAYQCLDALAFIHANHLIHCDLKPENVLIKSLSRCVVKVPLRVITCRYTSLHDVTCARTCPSSRSRIGR